MTGVDELIGFQSKFVAHTINNQEITKSIRKAKLKNPDLKNVARNVGETDVHQRRRQNHEAITRFFDLGPTVRGSAQMKQSCNRKTVDMDRVQEYSAGPLFIHVVQLVTAYSFRMKILTTIAINLSR